MTNLSINISPDVSFNSLYFCNIIFILYQVQKGHYMYPAYKYNLF
jgi:hypothetical protein